VIDACVAAQESCHIPFLFGRGGGRFSRGVFLLDAQPGQSGASRPLDIAAGDLDLDGKVDLVVAEFSQDRVRILWNDGTGFFEETVTILPVGDQPVALVVANLDPSSDPDGFPDIAVANRASDNVAVLLHAPADPQDPSDPARRQFQAAQFFSPGDGPADVAAEDLNGDGNPDLAIPLEGNHTVEIWQGAGTGAFSAGCSLAPVDPNGLGLVDPRPAGVVLADFDGDGDIDVAACNVFANKVTVWLNLGGPGGGCFSAASFHNVGSEPTGIAVADVIGDGSLDLITANRGSNDATVLRGLGDGSFTSTGGATISGLSEPWRVEAGNLVGNDGRADLTFACAGADALVVVEENPNLSLTPGAPAFRIRTSLVTGDTPRSLTAADLDGDGNTDLASADAFSDDVSVYHHFVLPATSLADAESYAGPFDRTPTGVPNASTFRPTWVATLETSQGAVPQGLDLVLTSFSTAAPVTRPAVQVLEGDGKGRFEELFSDTYPNTENRRPVAVVTGDFNGTDGDDDFAGARRRQRVGPRLPENPGGIQPERGLPRWSSDATGEESPTPHRGGERRWGCGSRAVPRPLWPRGIGGRPRER